MSADPTAVKPKRSVSADLRYVAFGMAVCALLVFIKIQLETKPIGQWAEKQTYALLAAVLPKFSADGPDVVIVDIAHLGGGKDQSTGALVPTSRIELATLLNAIALQRPLAIGVDIDFSPNEGGWVERSDPQFFDDCLRISLDNRVPIRLGVFRTMREGPDGWLGVPQYASLAGGLWLPKSGTRRLPMWLDAGTDGDRLYTLGAAVALAAKAERTRPILGAVTESTVESELSFEPGSRPLKMGSTVVNYSRIEQMKREVIPAATPADITKRGDDLRGKIVLVGDVKRHAADDIFPVPNQELSSPGVFLHASLANTLLREPVYEFTHGMRLALDFALTLVVLVIVVVVSRRNARDDHAYVHRLEDRVLMLVIAVIGLLGFFLIAYYRVLWLDFVLVCIFLFLHPKLERLMLRTKGGSGHGEAAA